MPLYNKPYKLILYILIISIFIGNSTRACESFIRYISDGDLLNENMPFSKNMTYLSAISNIFGAEYRYGFSLSSHSTDSIMMDRHLPAHHLAFDIGWMGIGGSSCRILDFGVRGRYEYGFDVRSYGTHRFGIETYYHPPLFNIHGWQIASVLFGVGGRLDNMGINGGTYIDAGMLILPSSPQCYVSYMLHSYLEAIYHKCPYATFRAALTSLSICGISSCYYNGCCSTDLYPSCFDSTIFHR